MAIIPNSSAMLAYDSMAFPPHYLVNGTDKAKQNPYHYT